MRTRSYEDRGGAPLTKGREEDRGGAPLTKGGDMHTRSPVPVQERSKSGRAVSGGVKVFQSATRRNVMRRISEGDQKTLCLWLRSEVGAGGWGSGGRGCV